MAWKKVLRKVDKPQYDISIGKWNVYIPKKSILYEPLVSAGRRYSLYVDEENKSLLIVPNSKGEHKFTTADNNALEVRVYTYAGRTMLSVLPIGRYKAERIVYEGKEAFVISLTNAVVYERLVTREVTISEIMDGGMDEL